MKSDYKSKKKTFAITTIVMVVMLILALSTATFAWYSTNSTVKANDMIITSATSNSAALAIDITKNLSSKKTSIDLELSSYNANNMPMIPMVKPVAKGQPGTVTTYTDFISDSETAGFNSCEVDGDNKFIIDATHLNKRIQPNRVTKAGVPGSYATQDFFWVINTNSEDVGVKVLVTIYGDGCTPIKYSSTTAPDGWDTINHYLTEEAAHEGGPGTSTYIKDQVYYINNTEIANHLRVAVFLDSELVDIWALGSGVGAQWGVIETVADADADDTTFRSQYYATQNATAGTSNGFYAFQIPAKDGVRVQLAAWFDGNVLTNVDMGSSAWFKVSFEVA